MCNEHVNKKAGGDYTHKEHQSDSDAHRVHASGKTGQLLELTQVLYWYTIGEIYNKTIETQILPWRLNRPYALKARS
jgi:hypothetical protein